MVQTVPTAPRTPPTPSRRQRLRQMTLDEIHGHALEQVREGGAEAVSLSAIARNLGMAQASIYRYYGSREELLGELRRAGYAEITAAVEAAERAAAGQPPGERLQALLGAYRRWALAHPYHYDLMFGARPGTSDSDEAIAAIHPAMRAVLRALAALAEQPATPATAPASSLEQELVEFSERRHDPAGLPPRLLRLGSAAWTRVHGIVSLELAGVFADMGVNPEHLLEHEVDSVTAEATRPAGRPLP